MKSTIFLCWAGSSIKSVPRTYSANFAGSEASSGAMSPSIETARLRADDRAGQEEMRCNASSVEPVLQSLHEPSDRLLRNLEISASRPQQFTRRRILMLLCLVVRGKPLQIDR